MGKLFLVNFKGGLGNQLFQYATARALAAADYKILFDIKSYDNDDYGRSFNLKFYNVVGLPIKLDNKILAKAFTPNSVLNRFLKKLRLYSEISENSFFIHRHLKSKLRLFTSLNGYWQSYTYFDNIRYILINELKPILKPDLPLWVDYHNTVAVHIRRADYLDDERYGFIGKTYYDMAFNILNKKLENPQYIIFSDDIPWCKSNFRNENITFCEDKEWQSDYLQIYLMSLCKHQIIANSSFSWWGAWLNDYKDKIIICPKRPFKDMTLMYEDYYPTEWIKI